MLITQWRQCLSVCPHNEIREQPEGLSLNLMRILPCHWNPLLSGIFKSPTLCYNKVSDAQVSEVGETSPSLRKSSNYSNEIYSVKMMLYVIPSTKIFGMSKINKNVKAQTSLTYSDTDLSSE